MQKTLYGGKETNRVEDPFGRGKERAGTTSSVGWRERDFVQRVCRRQCRQQSDTTLTLVVLLLFACLSNSVQCFYSAHSRSPLRPDGLRCSRGLHSIRKLDQLWPAILSVVIYQRLCLVLPRPFHSRPSFLCGRCTCSATKRFARLGILRGKRRNDVHGSDNNNKLFGR